MDFELPENVKLMRDTVHRFVKNDLEPVSQHVEMVNRAADSAVQILSESEFHEAG